MTIVFQTHLFFNLKQAQQPYRKFAFPIWALQFIHHGSVVLKLDGVSGMFMGLFYRKWSTWKTAKSRRNQTNAELKCSRFNNSRWYFHRMPDACILLYTMRVNNTVNSDFNNYIKCINVICMIDFDNHSWDSPVLASYLWLRCWSLWNWLSLKLKL